MTNLINILSTFAHMIYSFNLDALNLILDFDYMTTMSVLQDNQLFIFGCVLGLGLAITLVVVSSRPMPGVRCPNCAREGVETWVLPGKHCRRCAHPC